MRVLRTTALLARLTLILPTVAFAQEAPLGTVTGRVVDLLTRRGLEAATISILGTDRATSSAADGRFALAVPAGVHAVRVAAIGYRPVVIANVAVGPGKPVVLTAELEALPLALAALEVGADWFAADPGPGAGEQSLGTEDIRRAPGVNEDVVRAVALLPGVGVTIGGRNDLVVRGGAPYENLFLVDGHAVPNINHFGSQGSTGGPLSLINIDFVDQVRLAAGGFGARYGDRTSSVTAITLREGARERLSGELTLSATGVGAIVEGPVGDGSFLVGVRRSYLDLVFKAAGFSFIPQFWDLTVKTAHPLGAGDRLSFLLVGALNDITLDNSTAENRYDNSRVIAPRLRQYFSAVTWQHSLPRGVVHLSLGRTFTAYRTAQFDSLDPAGVLLRNRSREGETSLRAELTTAAGPRLTLTAGAALRHAARLRYDLALAGPLRVDDGGTPQPLTLDTTFAATRGGAFGEAQWRVRNLTVTAGVRGDWYGFLGDAVRAAPRLELAWAPRAGATLRLAAGRYWQAPSYIWLMGDRTNTRALQPFRADHLMLGAERLLRPDLKLHAEIWMKRYGAYPARVWRPQAVLAPAGFEDAQTDIPFGLEPLRSAARGRAMGLELFAQKRFSEIPLYGLASLSISRARFTALDGVERAGSYDARVIANLVAGYRFGARWEVSGKARLASGLPTTPFVTSGPATGSLDYTRANAGPRLPAFAALDVRVDRRWPFRTWQLVAYLDVQNVTGRRNVSGYQWNQRLGLPEANEALGLLPSIGLNVEF